MLVIIALGVINVFSVSFYFYNKVFRRRYDAVNRKFLLIQETENP